MVRSNWEFGRFSSSRDKAQGLRMVALNESQLANAHHPLPFSEQSMLFRRRFIRRTLLFLAALFMCSWLAIHSTQATRWRRTAQGWASNLEWESRQSKWNPPPATDVHPAVMTSFQLLLSIGGLLAFDRAFEKTCEPSPCNDETV